MLSKLISEDFKPTENEMDARIFYEITGEALSGFEAKLQDVDSMGSEGADPDPDLPESNPTPFAIKR